uniref:SXP/RAL-2 family protein Ani s 5-like cation-binding domain-containing protein n=1 Tax=Panagrolaimus sp. PS1159 TaxID=55785 RepID=A0AC35GCW5_9BILA
MKRQWLSLELNLHYGGLEKPLNQLKGSLSQEQLKQAHTIIENPNLTKQEIKDQIQQYFQKLGEPFYSKYKNASNTFENQIANMTAKAEALKANLSQPSKLIIDKILSIHKDLSITLAQEKEQVKALVQSAAPDVKQEIEKAKTQFQQKFGDSMGSTQEIL